MSPTLVLRLSGQIDRYSAISLIQKLEDARTSPSQPSEVRVEIDSQGGETIWGIILHDYFKFFPLPLTAVVDGQAKSAAAFAFVGAPNRMAKSGSRLMFHKSSPKREDLDSATVAEKKRMCDNADRENAHLRDVLKRIVDLSADEWNSWETGADCDIVEDRWRPSGVINADRR